MPRQSPKKRANAGLRSDEPAATNELRRAEIRADIIAAATTIFSSKGYAAATTKEIGEAVGLDNSTLYYYVPSKESLLYDIALSVYEPLARHIQVIEAEGGDEAVRLRRLVTAHLSAFADHVEATCVGFADWRHLRGDHLAEIRKHRDAYGRYVKRLITSGQRNQLFNPGLDPGIMTHAVLSLVNSLNVWYDPARRAPIATIIDNYLTLIFSGLTSVPSMSGDEAPSARAVAR